MKKAILSITLFCFFSFSQAQSTTNLVFEGGGIRGIAYCGALMELDSSEQLANLQRVGGTSAGAIIAALLAVGYSPPEIHDIIFYTDFENFNDGQYFFLGGTKRLTENYGWYKGDEFTGWLESHIARKTNNANLTFRQLHKTTIDKDRYDLYVTGTDLLNQEVVVFSYESYPDMRIADAIRISVSVPLWYEAVAIDESGNVLSEAQWSEKDRLMIDGGVISNYPLDIFDHPRYYQGHSMLAFNENWSNPQTLGLRLDTSDQILEDQAGTGQLAYHEIENIEDYVVALYAMVIENLNRNDLDTFDWQRTISIDSRAIGPRVRELSMEEKEQLVQCGRDAVSAFMEK